MTTWSGSQELDLAIADAAIATVAAVGPLDGVKLALVKNAMTFDRNTTLTDLLANEADFNTYAPAAITFNDPSIADDGEIEVIGTVPEFRPTDALAPNDIWGAFIENTGATKKYLCAGFEGAPMPMNSTLDSLIVTVRYRPRTGAYSVEVS